MGACISKPDSESQSQAPAGRGARANERKQGEASPAHAGAARNGGQPVNAAAVKRGMEGQANAGGIHTPTAPVIIPGSAAGAGAKGSLPGTDPSAMATPPSPSGAHEAAGGASEPSEPDSPGRDVTRAAAVTEARRGIPRGAPQASTLPPGAKAVAEADHAFLIESLRKMLLFSHLDALAQEGIVRKMYEFPIKAGEVLIREGSSGDELYVVKSGEFEVLQRRRGANIRVNMKARGDTFGEIALMYDCPRTASVVATQDAVVWALPRDVFRAYVHEHRLEGARTVELFLNSVPLLAKLPEGDRLRLVDALEERSFEQGEIVVREGEAGDSFYIVKDGQAAVYTAKPDGSRTRVNQLYPSDFFGEAALLASSPRTATVEAATRLTVLVLDRDTFTTILGPLQAVMEKEKDPDVTARRMDKLRSRGAPGRERSDVFVRRRLAPKGALARRAGAALSGALGHLGHRPDSSSGADWHVVRCRGHADEVVELLPRTGGSHPDGDGAGADGVTAGAGSAASFGERLQHSSSSSVVGGLGGSAAAIAIAAAAAEQADAQADAKQSAPERAGPDFPRMVLTEGGVLGGGAFSRVALATIEGSTRSYALKRMRKTGVVQCPEHVYWEQTIGHNVVHPFCLRQYASFQDRANLYMLTDLALGGDLMDVLVADAHVVHVRRHPNGPPTKMLQGLSEEVARFYVASLVLALEYLHDHNIVYRDLKPENVFLDGDGFIKLGDFGFAKLLEHGRKTYTFCGTPGYVAPENVLAQGYNFSVDWWGLGVLAYVLLTGRQPFTSPKTDDPMVVMRRIVDDKFVVQYPPYVSSEARDLVARLLERKPAWRLGMLQGRADDVKRHPWFAGVDWEALELKRVKPPRLPKQDAAKRLKEMAQQEATEDPPPKETPEELAACDAVFKDF